MILDQLIRSLPEVESTGPAWRGAGRREVTGVTSDGHRAGPGVVFVALPEQLRADPHLVEAAVARRPAAVIAPVGVPVPSRAASVAVRDSARALAVAAATIHGYPGRDLRVIEVDGASRGRGAAADYLFQFLGHLMPPAGLLAADRCLLAGRVLAQPAAGLDPFELQRSLAAHRGAGGTHVVLESPGAAVPSLGIEVLPRGLRVDADADAMPHRVVQSTRRGTVLALAGASGEVRVAAPVVGRRQVEALLAALAAGCRLGIPPERLRALIPRLQSPPGCLEPVAAGQPFEVRVDATPDPEALAEVLAELRPLTPGRRILVLGARADWSGDVWAAWSGAARGADLLVATVDDPGHADAPGLAARLAGGHPTARPEADRGAAIRRAVGLARPGDIVLVAGKGRASRLDLGHIVLPWDDRRAVRHALAGAGYPGEDWT